MTQLMKNHLSCVMRKYMYALSICENKALFPAADQRLCFHYIDSE